MKLMGSLRSALIAGTALAASATLVRAFVKRFLPRFSSELTVVIGEIDGNSGNQVFEAASAYLATKIPPSARRLRVSKQHNARSLTVVLERGEATVDVFDGVEFRWALVHREIQSADGYPTTMEERSLVLTLDKKHKDNALSSYLPYVLDRSKAIQEQDRVLKLHTNDDDDHWRYVDVHHPATFSTLVICPKLRKAIVDDLDAFIKGKEFYKRVGRPWKRGYLLHGPPGSGKTSLIGAIANQLRFDIYELNVLLVKRDSSLRDLFAALRSRSILVVKDIDCVVQSLSDAGPEHHGITLTGFLNLVEGLWAGTGEARFMVLTASYKTDFDFSELRRAGLMDMQLIYMDYCTPCMFRQLASKYHSLSVNDEHPLFNEIIQLLRDTNIKITPTAVADELRKSTDANVALGELRDRLRRMRD